jgi:hypothetical protein
MSEERYPKGDRTIKFLAQMLGIDEQDLLDAGSPLEMSGVISLTNTPEFWADAPWRLEPDRDSLPVSVHVRDADLISPAEGPWRLWMLCIEQRVPGDWHRLATLLPADLPDVDAQGFSQRSFWAHSVPVPLSELVAAAWGDAVHLRVLFIGSLPPHEESSQVEIHLETRLAEHPLPLGRAANGPTARHWFYGDTHYHSAYTNDIKEFGGALPAVRQAGQSVGLDWLVVTDHSCDLDDSDQGYALPLRWDRLKDELASGGISDDEFRCLLGEEITLLGDAGYPLHMLAFGGLVEMVEGAFLQTDADNFPSELARLGIERILAASKGYPKDTAQRLFGEQHPLPDVLASLPPDALAFAAHPFSVAQIPPARWRKADLAQPRLTGYEFWNGRARAKGSKATFNPFALASWNDEHKLQKADDDRITKLRQQAKNKWDPQLRRGVREWPAGAERPAWRPVFIGGSDAHCDFNYHVGWAWDYTKFYVDDNALGRVRTAVHFPDHATGAVPQIHDILSAIREGACVVTDGPLLEVTLEHAGETAAVGGELAAQGDGDLNLRIMAHTTPEFGPVERAEVVTYFCANVRGKTKRMTVGVDSPEMARLTGTRGYCRVEAQSKGQGEEGYCCFTNPIWVRIPDGKPRKLRITLEPGPGM